MAELLRASKLDPWTCSWLQAFFDLKTTLTAAKLPSQGDCATKAPAVESMASALAVGSRSACAWRAPAAIASGSRRFTLGNKFGTAQTSQLLL